MLKTVRILHVSDLHERVFEPRPDIVQSLSEVDKQQMQSMIRNDHARRERVLGSNSEKWKENLNWIKDQKPCDMLVFTGDMADWGLPEEYERANRVIQDMKEAAGVPPDRLFVVPGNHDIQRHVAKDIWKKLRDKNSDPDWCDKLGNWLLDAKDKPPWGDIGDNARDELLKREEAFWNWVTRSTEENGLGMEKLDPRNSAHGRLGYRNSFEVEGMQVNVIGLDTAWLAGGDDDKEKLLLTEQQVVHLTYDEKSDKVVEGLRIAIGHHPLSWLQEVDEGQCSRLLGERVHLYLHGHAHRTRAYNLEEPDQSLQQLMAGCLFEGSLNGGRHPNGFHILELHADDDSVPKSGKMWFRAWGKQGFWHLNTALYDNTVNGELELDFRRGRSLQSRRSLDGIHLFVMATGDDLDALARQDVISGNPKPFSVAPLMKAIDLKEPNDDLSRAAIELRRSRWQDIPRSLDVYVSCLQLDGEGVLDGWGDELNRRSVGEVAVACVLQHEHALSSPAWKRIQNMALEEFDVPLLVLRFAKGNVSKVSRRRNPIYIPAFPKAPIEGGASQSKKEAYSMLQGCLLGYREFEPGTPTVGVGGLLVNEYGQFWLMERRRLPGQGKLGTFGGRLERSESSSFALRRLAKERLGLDQRRLLRVGPLLSCTNMLGTQHFVDLTFLVLVTEPDAPQIKDSSSHIPYNDKGWFSFEEVARFLLEDKLFEPVANAFERFCLLCILGRTAAVMAPRMSPWVGTDTISGSQSFASEFESLGSGSADPDWLKFTNRLPALAEIVRWHRRIREKRSSQERSPVFFELPSANV